MFCPEMLRRRVIGGVLIVPDVPCHVKHHSNSLMLLSLAC
jgi:hypothetical protein